jgi:glutathione S-transferase
MADVPRLYVFAISHFCEKARWACDRKGMPYQLVPLLPGVHLWTMRRFSRQSQVPLLIHGEQRIQGSADIIDYLDATFPTAPLSPAEPEALAAARAWEIELDRELGERLRRIYYFQAFQNPGYLAAEWGLGGPFWSSWFYALAMPRMRRAIFEMYEVSAATAQADLGHLDALFERLDRHFAAGRFLVGDAFSRADLALASLAAGLLRPPEHPAQVPQRRPVLPAWRAVMQRYAGTRTAERVRELYRSERAFRAGPAPTAAGA